MKIKNAIPFLFSILCFIGVVIIKSIQDSYSLYFFHVGSDEIGFAIYLIGLFLLIMGIGALFFKRGTPKSRHIIGIILLLLILGTSILPTLYTMPTTVAWHEFKSPDRNHTIVVQEKAFLLAGGGTIYEKVSPILLKKITNYTTDDGYAPFRDNNYQIDWQENSATISYIWDYMYDEDNYKEINISFSGE